MDIGPLKAPELTTFGALIRHALTLEEFAATLLAGLAGECQGDPELHNAIEALAKQHRQRQQLLERTRREKLSEMILEPIEGLDGKNYVPPEGAVAGPGHGTFDARMRLAADLEATSARFYEDSAQAARMVLAEVGRIFERLARENRENQDRLQRS